MKYTGQFRDINDVLYTVEINTATPGEDVELTLGVPPITTEMDTEGDTIYAPGKYQGATLNIVSGDYLFDLYQPTAHGASVTLTRGGDVVWTGYVSPSLYDQGYELPLEVVSVDCIDGLSTLQYYKYTPIDTDADVHSFADIMLHCVRRAGCYSRLLLPMATRLGTDHTADLWRNGYISERNFIADTNDNKDGKTFKEVLEQICQYFGVTVYAEGDSVIVRDIDSTGNVLEVDVASGASTVHPDTITVHTIVGDDYAHNGATLSLDKVYSKATVTDDFETFASMLPDFFEGASNITKNDPEQFSKYAYSRGEFVDMGGDAKLLAMLDIHSDPGDGTMFPHLLFAKYYKPKNYIFHMYNGLGTDVTLQIDKLNYTDTRNMSGAFLVRMDNHTIDAKWLNPDEWTADFNVDNVAAYEEISKVSFTDYIFLLNHSKNGTVTGPGLFSDAQQLDKPFIEVRPTATLPAVFGGPNSYLVISGEVNWHTADWSVYPLAEGEVDIDGGRTEYPASKYVITARLQWGSLYWNGATWQNTPATFAIPYVKKTSRIDEVTLKDNRFINSVTWRIGTDAAGYLITMPTNVLASGQPKLTIYKPLSTRISTGVYENYITILKDFKLEAIYGDPTFSNPEDATSYSNVINEGHVEELSEINFKVCTNDNKRPNYNAVAYKSGGDLLFLDTTWHDGLNASEAGIKRYDGSTSDGSMRQEEHYVFRLVKQYSTPAKILELTLGENLDLKTKVLESNLDASFVIDSVNADYAAGTYTYRLVEQHSGGAVDEIIKY